MTMNRPNVGGMSSRQKIIAVLFILILIFLIWQIIGMFRSHTPVVPAMTATATRTPGMPNMTPSVAIKPAPIKPTAPMTPQELALFKLQQETQAKYLAAVSELQMLKIERDIAETNKAIMDAKLATITAQKDIVNLLKPPPVTPTTYTQGVTGQPPTSQTLVVQPEVSYNVISVSQLQNSWNAVIGYQGNLYSVKVGDILPPDGSKVIFIDRSGVVLDKNGARKKVSLVSII